LGLMGTDSRVPPREPVPKDVPTGKCRVGGRGCGHENRRGNQAKGIRGAKQDPKTAVLHREPTRTKMKRKKRRGAASHNQSDRCGRAREKKNENANQ